MQLTRMLSGPNSIAKLSVNPTSANFADEYGVRSGNPKRPADDDKFTIEPPRDAFSAGTARRVQ